MRKIKKTLLTVGVMLNLLFVTPTLLVIITTTNTYGQCWINPLNPENTIGNSQFVENTGNDVSVGLHISVWDGHNPGLSWNFGGPTTIVPLHSLTSYDPDVSIVLTGLFIYAVVVYYDAQGIGITGPIQGYYADNYKFVGGNFVYQNTVTLEAPTAYAGAINIDRITNLLAGDYFAIIWPDDAGNLKIQEGQGGLLSPTYLSQYNVHPLSFDTNPDISLFDNGNPTAYPPTIFFTYTNPLGLINVDSASFSNPLVLLNTPIGLGQTGAHPRIACPPPPYNDCIVVYDGMGGTIKGYEYNYANNYDYTNGCLNLSLNKNSNPVVSYVYDGLSGLNSTVAWTYNETIPWTNLVIEPIAVKCDAIGDPGIGFSYYKVPFTQTLYTPPYFDIQNTISICGKGNIEVDYTWFYENNNLNTHPSNIRYKSLPFYFPTLRLENDLEKKTLSEGINPNPNNGSFRIYIKTEIGESINLEIYNSIGQIVYTSNEISNSTDLTKDISLNNFHDGIYFVKEKGTKTNKNWRLMISK